MTAVMTQSVTDFSVGDYVVYPAHGVGKIGGVEHQEVAERLRDIGKPVIFVANNFLESEVSELMKAVSHAYARGRFQSYSG